MTYRSTVARQPESLADTWSVCKAALAETDVSAIDKPVIGITGIGASFAAAVVGAAELQECGKRAFAIRAADLASGHDLADALVGLSHRGRSVETVSAFQSHASAMRLSITNDPDSPLAQASQIHVTLNNGSDATPSSTGYTATLLAMGMVFEKLSGADADSFAAIPDLAGQTLTNAAGKMARLRNLFSARRAIDCVGAGASLGTADGASLLIREASRIPASAYDTRHYLHGPMESMDATTGVVIFGDEREVELAHHLDRIGCPTLLVTTLPGIDDGELLTVVQVPRVENLIAQGIVNIFTAQLFAAELSDAAGLTDVKFRYRMSDTKIPLPENA
ncbi:SIS domain-containing protein [Sinirhodobacter populi]|uniref:Glutamine--fructose-6-phosphate aminotransferase [isomerizing] n=1 Tax=Paenirhodobacter populi TaxID=2306993 RepID=A0A443JZE5_9RHOB|nr:SIS domain-containing protein [Sinirhodobacter populi]RWR25913.1 SIS domain-containing protein [Sinirhodobacter populi]